jgi:hypothetical protein
MLRPFMQTLKHIALDFNFHGEGVDVDPLFGIPSEFEDMRSKNIIEIIEIHVQIATNGNCRVGDDWRRLDEVLTAPGWISLKEVNVIIWIDRDNGTNEDNNSELVVALQNLPETQFPRLSSSKNILFNFDII